MSSYKCWSPDLGIEEEEAKIVAEAWMGAEEAASKYVDDNYSHWEYPDGPFNILVYECTPDGSKAGPVRKFNVEVQYEPQFYTYEVEDKSES